jgi:tripartite-type tricarboxylate transporter receptor subunit TctC
MGFNFDRRAITVLGLTFLIVFTGNAVFGADYPAKPINLMVAVQAGGGTDTDARSIAPFLEKYLGVRVTIENIPGANGKIGVTKFSKIKPDGYNLLVHKHPSEVIQPRIMEVEYKAEEFIPIYLWTSEKSAIVCASNKWKTLEEVIKEGHERPLTISIAARGSPSHFNGLKFVDKTGIKARWVPFSAAAESLSALAGGHVDLSPQTESSITPLIKAEKLRPLVIMSTTRSRFYPNVPLAKEVGYDIDWIVVAAACWAPPNTPPDVLKKLEWAFEQAAKDPGYSAWAKDRMVEVSPLNTKESLKLIEEQTKVILRDIPRFRETLMQ